MLRQAQKRTWSRDYQSENRIKSQAHSPTKEETRRISNGLIMTWDLSGAQSPVDCFLAAQTLGIQSDVDVLIFMNVSTAQLIECVQSVRTPFQSVSVNTAYGKYAGGEAKDNCGYLILYREDVFSVQCWPRFYKPALFLHDEHQGAAPFYFQLKEYHGQTLDIFAWKLDQVCSERCQELLQIFMQENESVRGVMSLTLDQEGSQTVLDDGQWTSLNTQGAVLLSNSASINKNIVGVRALRTENNHEASVIQLEDRMQ